MKILYVCADPGIPFWGTKGASIHVRSFAGALVAAGHEVHVIVSRIGKPRGPLTSSVSVSSLPVEDEEFFKPGPEASLDEATLLHEARQFSQNQALRDVMNDILARDDFDVVCERYSLFSYAGRECARWHNLPYILEANAPLILEAREHRHLVLSPLAVSIEHFLFSTADHVIPVSARLGEYIQSISHDARITVIPNGVDLQRFELSTDSDTWRTSWVGTDTNAFVIGFVGSLKPWHGINILLESFAQVHHTDPQAHLVFVGGGPEQAAIEKFVDTHKLAANVHLTGAVAHEHVPDALGAMDALVAPYPEMESFYFSPLKLYEYMAAGKPIVASAIGQITDIVTERESGLLIPPGDVIALTARLMEVREDVELARRLGQNAREIAFASHGWNRRIEMWEATVSETLNASDPRGVTQ